MSSAEAHSSLAPVALFAYRRPEHLTQTLNALRANQEARNTELYVFSDAAKEAAAEAGVTQVRRLLSRIDGFAAVHRVFRNGNFGLARNITEGVSDVLSRHDNIVVLEDDVVVSPFFLRFMNNALSCYRNEPRVGSISAYVYPLSRRVPKTFFIRGADCWGWATWRDRWTYFEPDGQALLRQLRERNLTSAFDFDGAMGYTAMLEEQIAGKNDSWAVRWHASCFLRDLLILYSAEPLARNIGQDGSGTHFNEPDESFELELSRQPVHVGRIPIVENVQARAAFRDFFLTSRRASTGRKSWVYRLRQTLRVIRHSSL
jgi:hypothetical protein